MENQELYIPMGIKSKRDKIAGFGDKELFIIAILSAVTLIAVSIYYSISQDSFGAVFVCLLVAATALVFLKKNETNQSVLDLLTHVIHYLRGQKKFKYKYLKEWQ